MPQIRVNLNPVSEKFHKPWIYQVTNIPGSNPLTHTYKIHLHAYMRRHSLYTSQISCCLCSHYSYFGFSQLQQWISKVSLTVHSLYLVDSWLLSEQMHINAKKSRSKDCWKLLLNIILNKISYNHIVNVSIPIHYCSKNTADLRKRMLPKTEEIHPVLYQLKREL